VSVALFSFVISESSLNMSTVILAFQSGILNEPCENDPECVARARYVNQGKGLWTAPAATRHSELESLYCAGVENNHSVVN
jgi:hypothetical protein